MKPTKQRKARPEGTAKAGDKPKARTNAHNGHQNPVLGTVEGGQPAPTIKDKPIKLRFAALVRVSTPKQEAKGESLRTQTTDLERIVASLNGAEQIEWYGGQEHATPGHEKKEIQRLLQDAKRKCFDAVIVTEPLRWSRDNEKSKEGLDVFRENGIRFFAGSTEFNLFDPTQTLVLGMFAEIGQFFASIGTKTSTDNRIARAKGGVPSGGRVPFGRIYVRTEDRQGGEWKIDEAKQAIIVDCAKRYLAGESIPVLAKWYKMNASNLHKILTQRSGKHWEVKFDVPKLKIKENITIKVPELLDKDTIDAIHAKVEKNRTYLHGHIKHEYLFSRMIVCAHCGYAMMGQTNRFGHRYYRHAHKERDRVCPGPQRKAWIKAEVIEDAAMRQMFEAFGNPAAVQKAIEQATPNNAKIQEAAKRLQVVVDRLAKIEPKRQLVLNLVLEGKISKASSDTKFAELNADEAKFTAEESRLRTELANVPDKAAIKEKAKSVAEQFRQYTSFKLWSKKMDANTRFGKMTYAERRELCQSVFSGKTSDGKRMGIWITWSDDGTKWTYRIAGHLIEEEQVDAKHLEFGSAYKQKALVAKSALH